MAWLEDMGISGKFTDAVGLTGTGNWADNWRKGMTGENQGTLPTPKMEGTLGGPEAGLALESRGMQGEYGNLLRAQMAGRGPSLARMQLAQGRDAAVRGALASAASARGANAALAGRSAAQSAGRVGQQAARDASLLKAQEQLSAQQQFGNLANAMRGQDIQSRGLTSAEQQAQLNADVARMNAYAKISEGEAERRQQAYGGLTKMAGSVLGISDPITKQNVQPIGTPMQSQQPSQPASQAQQPVGYSQSDLSALNSYTSPAAMTGMQTQQMQYGMENLDPSRQFVNRNSTLQAAGQTGQQANAEQDKSSGMGGIDLSGIPGMDLSTPDVKGNIQPQAGGNLVRAAAQAQPIQFQYSPEAAAAEGVSTQPRVGMAANRMPGSLEENPVYGPAVQYGPDGLARVNTNQATLANIAVTSDLARQQEDTQSRLDNLERVAMKNASGKGAKGEKVSYDDVVGMSRARNGARAVGTPDQRDATPAAFHNAKHQLYGKVPGQYTTASLTSPGDEEQLANTARRIKNEQTPRGQFPGQGRSLDDPEAHNAALAEADWKANNLFQATQDRQRQRLHQQGQAYDQQVKDELKRRRAPGGMQPAVLDSHLEKPPPPEAMPPVRDTIVENPSWPQQVADRSNAPLIMQGKKPMYEALPVPGFDGKRDKMRSDYGKLEDQKTLERSWRLDDTYMGADGQMHMVEEPVGDAAAMYNEAGKDKSKKHSAIRLAAEAMSGGMRPDATPNLVYRMLKQRGVKTSLKEVKAAMANDQYL